MTTEAELREWNAANLRARDDYDQHHSPARGVRVTRTCPCGARTEAKSGTCRTCTEEKK